MDRRRHLLELIKELVKIPSVTESAAESAPGLYIKERLEKLSYFRERPQNLQWIDTPLEGAAEKLRSLVVRVDAARTTKRTLLLIGHYDVVDIACYGDLIAHAFDADWLNKYFEAGGDDLYGRGTMDMKCGVALEIDLIEEFAADRSKFDVNLVFAFVGDEENSSAGMRGVLPALASMQKEGLEFLAALNTEPGEAGHSGLVGPMVYLGTLGKLMPSFYVRGRDAHVGNYYDGYSAILAAARIVAHAEGNPNLADPLNGVSQPSWMCIDIRSLRDVYSVTVADRACAYFNCFTTRNTPADVMEQMKFIASTALEETTRQLAASYRSLRESGYEGGAFLPPAVRVLTLAELTEAARKKVGPAFDNELKLFIESIPPGDMRARGIKAVDHIADLSGLEGPYAVCFFLPPWLPVRTDLTNKAGDQAVAEAARAVGRELEALHGLKLTEIELFAGLCDLSYVGASVSEKDVEALSSNMPGWGSIYKIPLKEMQGFALPVVNLGPSGEEAHRKGERLHLRYSLDILPGLLRSLIREISVRRGNAE